MTSLILGSASPRRARLLESMGVFFDIVPSHIDEAKRPHELADDYARRTAREKAMAVAQQQPEAWVLGSDTVVAVGDEVLGKPADGAAARRMLQRLSNRRHRVLTGVALVAPGGVLHEEACEESVVHFRRLGDDEIDAYVESGEPMDKAGAYAIQGGAADFVTRLQGSYENVVGLPVETVREMLTRAAILPQRRGG